MAKRPPSSGTSGRRSGGITGTTVMIIHSGWLPDWTNASISFRRLASFFGFSSDFDSAISCAELHDLLLEVERHQHLADGLRADHGGEGVVAVLVLRLEILVLGQELLLLQRRDARLDDDVVLEIEDALDVLQRHVEHEADARRQRLQEPDVRDRRGELDMAHALAPHARERHLDAALLADDALVLHALVLAAQALVVLDRAEDARAEQAVALRLEGAVVDRLRLLDLAVGPGQDLFRARERDADLVEGLRLDLRAEDVHDLLVHAHSLAVWHVPRSDGGSSPRSRRGTHC